MAELAASAFAAFGTEAAAGGALLTGGETLGSWAAGTTVTSAAGASMLAPSSLLLTVLQGAATISSMTSSMLGGAAANQNYQARAEAAELDASGARIDAEAKAVAIQREAVQKIGAARVAFAGSGVDISGSGAIEDSLQSQSDYEQGLARTSGQYSAARSLTAADNYRSQGRYSLIGAASKALGTGLDYAVSIAKRG